ncbi:MAG: hypothetical protein QOF78_1278 [Phycisphaerales bacterium]|nr:hypothetical protein [Phycisphaerales bacterium]
MRTVSRRRALSALCVLAICATSAPTYAAYVAKKLIGGLNQPTFVTAAPGDDNNLYVVQRAGAGNTVGDIVRYNKTTGVTSPYFNVPGSLVQDGGLLGMTFHPDFQTNGLVYVTSLVGAQSKLEEYQVAGGGQAGGTPAFRRTVLEYTNPRTQHTIDWVGFKPGALGAERNVLYVTTGDGGVQADSSNGTWVNNGQNPTTVMGKMLRLNIDISAPDAYPADATKNFAIPANNPFVADATGKLKEILHTGFRNPWRASFDKQTGDLYVGDVGFNTKEEVDFVKNDASFLASRDFGWGKREGTVATPIGGVGAVSPGSINPIFEVNQDTFQSMTGGFVYRGPVAELQGKYLFGDFNSGKIFAFDFDRDTDPATFNGATAGITHAQDMTAIINGLIDFNGGGGPITGLVSFGEDNAGNLYLVSMGTGNIFNPALGTGAVYTIIPEPATGAVLLLGGAMLMVRRRSRRWR